MVFITLKLIVFLKKNSANFLTLKFLFFFVLLLPSFIMNWWIAIYCSGELQVILFIFSFIWRYFDFVIKFCFIKRT